VVVISPRNYFLFTPLLPSCTTGTIEHRSIMEPIRNILRHKKAKVKFYEAEATKIDYEKKIVYAKDDSEIKGDTMTTEVPFDMLVVGVGAENATFGIPGVREHACFLKEVGDAQRIRKRIMDCVETATFKDQSPEEIKRLLHMVVVGGGPTGVEFAGELQDFFLEDLQKWVPQIKDDFHVTLVEALPNVLPMFSKQLIEYTESSFKEEHIEIRTKTMVKNVTDKYIEAEVNKPDGTKVIEKLPYGLLVWATGNALRAVVKDLMSQIPSQKNARRGLEVNEYLVVNGTENIWAVGDCAVANYAPTAQVAAQEGAFLARLFNTMAKTDALESELQELSAKQATAKPDDRTVVLNEINERQKQLRRVKQIGPFQYSHQGSLAYIGAEKAVADVSWFAGNIASGGTMTYLFWKSAYLSMCFSSKLGCLCPPFPPFSPFSRLTDLFLYLQPATVSWSFSTGPRPKSSAVMCPESSRLRLKSPSCRCQLKGFCIAFARAAEKIGREMERLFVFTMQPPSRSLVARGSLASLVRRPST
jgi:NADH:ubiquinone reductase (non-electrogenic)